MSSIRGRGWASVMVASLSARKSTTSLNSPGRFLGTGNDGLLQALTPSSILPSSTSLSINDFHASPRGPWIWYRRCLTGTEPGFSSMVASPKGPRTGAGVLSSKKKTESKYFFFDGLSHFFNLCAFEGVLTSHYMTNKIGNMF